MSSDLTLNAFATADPSRVIDQHGPWRLVVDPNGGDVPWAQFRMASGAWVWPDCSYFCDKCDACLGCERKMVVEEATDGTWSLDREEIDGECPHECDETIMLDEGD